MNQLYEKKCHCQPYDEDGHRSTLLKMELPEYEDSHYPSMSHSIASTIRFAFYLLVLVLLGYSLWRIHEIESAINASERYQNITRLIESNNLNHQKRIARSVEANSFIEPNGLGGMGGKDELRGMMLMARDENPSQVTKKFLNKDDFVQHMNDLFDKIQAMHNDSDRSHFDNNMKAVFQAWFPVFDALLPREMIENPDNRTKRSAVKSSEESSEEKKPARIARSVVKSSEESSEEKKKQATRVARSVDKKSSEESDEKKERKQEPSQKSSEESGEKKEQRPNKSSEESSEEKKTRTTRSAEQSSEESSEVNNDDDDDSKQDNAAENKNSEEESSEDKSTTEAANVANEGSEEEHARKVRSADDQSSEESSDSSDSSDSYESSKPSKRYEPLAKLKQDYIRASKYVYNLQRRLMILEQEKNNMIGENEINKM